jgi:glycolate oxidase iron-sulfur subunit
VAATPLDLRDAEPLLSDCVHCGFCLDSCPTYLLWGRETDSPRGRIVLIDDALADGEVSPAMVRHIDSCLGCLACVSACPSGVRYDRLLARARPAVERAAERSGAERALRRLLFETLPHPARLRRLAPLLPLTGRLADRLPARLEPLAKLAPAVPARGERKAGFPALTPAHGERRGRVALLLGCVQRVFYPEVHRATIGALAAEGFEVLAPASPECCGALELHAGEEAAGVARARATIAALDGLGHVDHFVVNAAGCGAAMREYGDLLDTPAAHAFSARVRDVSELLADEPRAPRGEVRLRVVYHDACHLRHAQGVVSEPRALLDGIPGLQRLEVPAEAEICCGSAGVYNLLHPEPAAELGARKAKLLLASGAEAIAAGNPGCTAQLSRHLRELGRPLPVVHPVELVWRSIQGGRSAAARG